MCASGARSPLAPTEPCAGTTGVTPRLSSSHKRSSVAGLMPEWPAESELTRSTPAARTNSSRSGAPVPAEWLRTRLRCKVSACSRSITTLAMRPNPVVTP